MTVEKHYYVSTYCIHEEHEDCRQFCKQCEARCLCPCHLLEDYDDEDDEDEEDDEWMESNAAS